MTVAGVKVRRVCIGLALAWLLLAPQLRLLPFDPDLVQIDFPQFYLAGALVDAGQSDALYPIARPESQHHPGMPADSEPHPAYAARAAQLGVSRHPRFIGPPPLAVVLAPMGLLPYPAAVRLWLFLLGLAQWGSALLAARFLVLILGRRCGWEGPLVLGIALSPRSYVAVIEGNVSPLMGLSLGLFAWWALRDRPVRAGAALVAGTLLKYAAASLVPLLLAARRWRVLAAAGAAGAGVLAFSFLILGSGPFRVWLGEIAPRLGRAYVDPYNQSLWSVIAAIGGATRVHSGLRDAVLVVGLAVWLAFCGLLFRRPAKEWRRPAFFLAASAGLLAWLLIFSPISWNTYQVYVMPFWGWLVWEGMRSRRRAVLVAVMLGITNVPWLSLWRHGFGHLPPAPLELSGLFASAVIFGLASARILEGWRTQPPGLPLRRSL